MDGSVLRERKTNFNFGGGHRMVSKSHRDFDFPFFFFFFRVEIKTVRREFEDNQMDSVS